MRPLSTFRSKLQRVEGLIASSLLDVAFLRLRYAIKAGFNLSQPRDDEGRWVGGGGDAQVQPTQGDRLSGYPIDLREEDANGGHTIEEHVAKSPEYLTRRLQEQMLETQRKGDRGEGLSVGSFTSLDSATRLVNSTIAQNQSTVDQVADHRAPFAVIESQFNAPTGYEAYTRTERSESYMRETYGVRVVIRPDPSLTRGCRFHSDFPINK